MAASTLRLMRSKSMLQLTDAQPHTTEQGQGQFNKAGWLEFLEEVEGELAAIPTAGQQSVRICADRSLTLTLMDGTPVTLRDTDGSDLAALQKMKGSPTKNSLALISRVCTQWGDNEGVSPLQLAAKGFLRSKDAIFIGRCIDRYMLPTIDDENLPAEEISFDVWVTLSDGSCVIVEDMDAGDIQFYESCDGTDFDKTLDLIERKCKHWGNQQKVTVAELKSPGFVRAYDLMTVSRVIKVFFLSV